MATLDDLIKQEAEAKAKLDAIQAEITTQGLEKIVPALAEASKLLDAYDDKWDLSDADHRGLLKQCKSLVRDIVDIVFDGEYCVAKRSSGRKSASTEVEFSWDEVANKMRDGGHTTAKDALSKREVETLVLGEGKTFKTAAWNVKDDREKVLKVTGKGPSSKYYSK